MEVDITTAAAVYTMVADNCTNCFAAGFIRVVACLPLFVLPLSLQVHFELNPHLNTDFKSES